MHFSVVHLACSPVSLNHRMNLPQEEKLRDQEVAHQVESTFHHVLGFAFQHTGA